MRAAWLKWGRRWWRVVPLAFAVLSGSASAQVAGLCGAGKNCSVNALKVTGSVPSAGTQPAAIQVLDGKAICLNAACSSYVDYNIAGGALRLVASSTAIQVSSGVASASHYVSAATGFSASVAYASFPACAAGTLGRLLYDSTNDLWRYCGSDSVWHPMPRNTDAAQYYQSAQWSSVCFGTCSTESSNFTGGYTPRGDTEKAVTRITCAWGTAGTGGTTGVVVRLYDVGGAAELCSCTLGACTTAANTNLTCSCASGVLASSKNYAVQLKSTTDCTGNPSNIVCNTE